METTVPTENRTELPFGQHHAFIIGIDKYEQISPLQTAVNDARKLAEVLAAQQHFRVHAPLLNAKGEAIRQLLQKTLPGQVQPDDRVLFYFAGHGIAADGDDGPAGYIVPADADPTEVKTFIPMEDLHQSLNALPCRHLLLILDCCFSGAFKWSSQFRAIGTLMPKRIYKERFDRFVQDPAWQVLTSAAYDQKALDVLQGKATGDRGMKNVNGNLPHSPFALALFEGLSGAADAKVEQEGDGVITATELYSYIRDQIEPATIQESQKLRQTPGFFPLKKHDKGEFIFLHPRHRLNLPPIPKRNPYKGLQSFNEEDRELFYGRDRVIAELRAQCEANRLLVVSGVSGIGKSSVVKAGLLPVLREEGFRILPVLRPGINPVFALELVLKEAGLFSPRASLRKLVLNDLIKKLADGKTVLLIDQYEELLTQCSNEAERQLFATILRKLLEGTPPECFKIIATVRADFETQFDQGELKTFWQAGRYTIPWFTVEELKEVIVMPTLQEVLIIDPPELVDEIINEVIQQPGALPLLSYTLSELYEVYIQSGRQDRALKKEDYNRLGGVMGALRTKADQLYQALDAAQQSTMRKIMLRMVSAEGELAGRRVMMDELIYADPAENQRVDAVIQKLVEARLVVKGKDYVEPAHDALVRAWKTLLEWIHAVGKEKIARQQRLKEQVEDYEEGKHDKNLLWDKDPRVELMKLELDNPETSWLNQKESNFITQSLAEKESKRKFKRRLIGASLSVLMMLLALIIVFVIRALVLKYYDGTFSDAKHFEEKAGSPIEDQSSRERQKSWLYTLAALGQDLDQNKSLPVSANRLIRQGVAAGVYQQIWSSPGTLGDINDIALSPDGKLLAIASEDGSVRLGDMQTGVERHALSGHTHGVSAVAFSPDGKWLASASKDSTIRLWNVVHESFFRSITGLKGEARGIAFSPDGKFIAAGLQEQIIYILNAATGARIDTFLTTGAVRSVTYSPDGRWLAAASADSNIGVWENASHTFKYRVNGHSMIYSPDSKKLATAANDGTIRLWNAQTRAPLQTLNGPHDEVNQLAFSLPDGKWLAAVSADGAVWIWDLNSGILKNTLRCNSGKFQRVAFSPDSSHWLISAGSDRSLRLWDIVTGKELAALAGHRDKINCMVFSETDRLFASGSDDGTIILWEAATGQPVRRFEGHQGAVLSLAMREYASLLVSGGKDGTIRLWNIDNGSQKILAGHTAAVNNVAFDPTDSYLASGSEDKTIRLWKISDGSSLRLGAYTSSIKSVAFSKKGALLAAGANDGTICLWDLHDGKNQLVVRWYGHAKAINALAFNLDGTRLASASADDEIRLWDMSKNSGLFDFFKNNAAPNLRFELLETKIFTLNERSLRDLRAELGSSEIYAKLADERTRDQAIRGEANFLDTLRTLIGPQDFAKYKSLILERASKSETEELTAHQINAEAARKVTFLDILRGHEDDVLSVSFSEDGRLLASGSRDESARLWEVNSGSELAVLSGHQDDVQAVAFNHESPNAILATASSDRSIRLWDVLESCNLDDPIFNKSALREIAFSPNGQYLASVDEDKLLRLWKQNTKRPDRFDSTFSVHGGWGILLSVAFSPDNAWLVYGGKDDVIRLMDMNSKSHQLISLTGNVGDGLSVAFHPRARFLAAGSSDGKVRVWDLNTKKMISPAVNAHQDKVRCVAFSPDGQLLASAGSDKLVKLWRFNMGKLEYWKTFDNNQSGVWSVDFSPDGNTLATACWDNSIHLWNYQIDQSRQFRGHRGPVLSVKFSPDGKRLASGSWDHTIRLWEVKSGRELDVITVHKAPVRSVAFHPNGRLLVSASEDKSIRLRDLSYLNAIELMAGDSMKVSLPSIAATDTSARIRDLIYLTSPGFWQLNATFRPFQNAFQAYTYQLAYRLNNEQELAGEPLKFYWQVEDSVKIKFAPHEFAQLRRPRPRDKGPLQWSLQNVPETEQHERRKSTLWLGDIWKSVTGLSAK